MAAKVQYRCLTAEQRIRHVSVLQYAMRQCGVTEDGQYLVSDLLTKSEITMLARRIQIARRILAGQSVNSIRKELRVGIHTIAAVERWLHERPTIHRFVMTVPG